MKYLIEYGLVLNLLLLYNFSFTVYEIILKNIFNNKFHIHKNRKIVVYRGKFIIMQGITLNKIRLEL